jgi:hypothetical protein
MNPVRAQFVERRGPSLLLWALVLAGALVAGALNYRTHRATFEQEAQRLHAELLARDAAEQAARTPPAPLPYAESLKEIEGLREVPWPQLLTALEVMPRGELQIASIEIDVPARRANVTVVAPTMKALTVYLESLNSGVQPGSQAWRWSAWRLAERTGAGIGIGAELRVTWSVE